ncbi:hypothetical protein ACFVR2_17385 [Gottfriedia sp. NPDC057991]|uniref:hypothetical protein n=1 Tax=Gottfriedia sp. NPDC057991 TaxID=3346298 RepID=UPI0036DF3024
MSPLAVQAATKNFTFSMTHQLSIGTYKSTKGSVTGKVTMKSWEGDNYFTIHVYEVKGGSSVLITRLGFEKSSIGSPYVDTDNSVITGHTYTYEIWKKNSRFRVSKLLSLVI